MVDREVRYCIDIDGTICTTHELDYNQAKPIIKAVQLIQNLKKAGHYIILFTARGTLTGTDWREVTKKQMLEWEVPFDELVFGKPAADIYIDDKALPAEIWRQLP
jgi:ribonucleotide monophosphatase NagD (HAD superfamily)